MYAKPLKQRRTPAAKRGVGNHSGEPYNKGKESDLNVTAFSIVQQATEQIEKQPEQKPAVRKTAKEKNAAAVSLGRLGGLKDGKARAAKLTPEQRAEMPKVAAQTRWKKTDS